MFRDVHNFLNEWTLESSAEFYKRQPLERCLRAGSVERKQHGCYNRGRSTRFRTWSKVFGRESRHNQRETNIARSLQMAGFKVAR